ncbi:MAG: hypothetical protein E7070_05275 [Bacteroidales bacterium]|nr:hypothetical protein [Bacteroidales bacterium]
MIYKDGTVISRIVRRDLCIMRIYERGRETYHFTPEEQPATQMKGLKVTAVEDGTVFGIFINPEWPLQYSRGWGWHDCAPDSQTRGTLLLRHMGDSVWLRPKKKFGWPSWSPSFSPYGSGRYTINDGLADLLNPDNYCYPARKDLIPGSGSICTYLTGHVELRGNFSAWNASASVSLPLLRSCVSITSVNIPEDAGTWNFRDCSSLASVIAPKAITMPYLAGTAIVEAYFPSATTANYAQDVTTLERLILPKLATHPTASYFSGCTALSYVRVGFTSWRTPSGNGWLYNVAANGTFIKHAALPVQYGSGYIPTGWTVLVDTPAITATGDDYDSARSVTLTTQLPEADIYFTTDGTEPSATNGTRYTSPLYITATTTIRAVAIDQYGPSDILTQTVEVRHALTLVAATAGSTVELTATGTAITTQPALEYSTDGTTWQTLAVNTPLTLAAAGDRLHLRATASGNVFWRGLNTDRAYFTMTGSIRARGSVMSLLDPTWYQDGAPAITTAEALHGLFEGCTSLIGHAPELPALTGAQRCYAVMFKGCTGLTWADIGLTSLSAFGELSGMFNGCTSLCYVRVKFSAWDDADYATDGWMDGVAAKGTFRAPSALPWVNDASHIPTGWGSMLVANLIDAADELSEGSFEAD